jgi:hypothetical protein
LVLDRKDSLEGHSLKVRGYKETCKLSHLKVSNLDARKANAAKVNPFVALENDFLLKLGLAPVSYPVGVGSSRHYPGLCHYAGPFMPAHAKGSSPTMLP